VFSRVFLLLAQFGPSEKNDPNQDNGGGGGTTNRGEAIWAAARPSETAIDASMDNFVKDVVGGQDGQRLDIDNQTLGAPMQNTSSAETTMVGPVSVEAVRQLFKNYDFDDSGEISFEELKDMLVKMHESSEGKSLTPEQAEFDSTLVMKTLDSDGGGLIGQGKRKTPIATCCLCWYCREDRVLLLLLTLFFFFFLFLAVPLAPQQRNLCSGSWRGCGCRRPFGMPVHTVARKEVGCKSFCARWKH
jgi:Ca2+-binding EF-hand superfamily protein